MASIIQKLGQAGWLPVVSSDLRRMGDCANVLMQYSPQQRLTDDISSHILVIGISGFDKLRIFTHHAPITNVVKEAVRQNLSIQSEEAENSAGVAVTKIKIHGTPWGYVSEQESIAARGTIARFIQDLAKLNVRLLINFNTKPSADTFFFTMGADPAVVDTPDCGLITLGLNSNDQLRVIAIRKDAIFNNVINSLRKVIQKHWHRGLQDEWTSNRSHTFKMKGNPWWTDGAETVESRIVICKILEAMVALGWRIACATDISRKPQDKTTFIFKYVRYSHSVVIPCLSFNESDKIRAINMPGDCLQSVGQVINKLWTVTRTQTYGRSTEWKLSGCIWDFSNYYGKSLALHLLTTMNSRHYALYTSADVSSKYVHRKNAPDYPMDVHSWFFLPVSALSPPPQPEPVQHIPVPSGDTLTTPPFSSNPSLSHLWDPTAPYSPTSRNPSPYHSFDNSPEASPVPSPASTPTGRGTPVAPSAPSAPPYAGYRGASAPYFHPGHSDFEPLPGGPLPEINLETTDDQSSSDAAHGETPPPSYDDVVRGWT